MLRSRIVLVALAAAAISAPALAFADSHASDASHPKPDCEREGATMMQRGSAAPVLSDYRIVSVTPYYEQQTRIKTTWNELRGATIRVEARPGLTSEWLQLRLNRELGARPYASTTATDDPLVLPGVSAHVVSASDGFLVTIAGQDKATAGDVLRRAQALQAQQHS